MNVQKPRNGNFTFVTGKNPPKQRICERTFVAEISLFYKLLYQVYAFVTNVKKYTNERR